MWCVCVCVCARARVQKLTNNSSVSLGMRDVDRDFTSHIIATKDSGVTSVKDLAGKKLAVGTVDSPQAYSCILPLHRIATAYHYISTVLVLLHSWHPHTTIYLASLYSYICALILQAYILPLYHIATSYRYLSSILVSAYPASLCVYMYVCIYIHTYNHTYIHTIIRMHTYIHTYFMLPHIQRTHTTSHYTSFGYTSSVVPNTYLHMHCRVFQIHTFTSIV